MLRTCFLDFGGSWDVHLPLVEFSYNNSYHSSVRCASFEALYGLDRLKAVQFDRKKCYAVKRRKPLEFSIGDYVLLKVSPWKGLVAYRLRLLEELNGVHDTFHVSNLKKCLANRTLQVTLDEIQVDAKLNFMEEPVEILGEEFKKLTRSRIAIVKVRWNSKRGPEFMWEREDHMKLKSPHLFSASSSWISRWCLEVFLARPKTHLTSDLFALIIIMANPPPDDLNTNLPEDESIQPEHAPAMFRFAPAMLNVPNNNNG
ncbi:putative reverse transcriptase domain-containing protein [Tanacetum coccineum]